MKTKLSFRELLAVGSMLFGLFFGAGNLIFPASMGQLAGSQVLAASAGLLVTGVGLPLLGVVPEDDALPLCMNRGVPILLADGQSAASAYRNIAKRLQGERVPLLRIR